MAGTNPSSGNPRRFDTSSGVLTVSSRYSRPNARPNATSMPAIIAVNHSRRVFGENGPPGTSARSMTCTLFERLLLTTCSSFSCVRSDCHSCAVAVGLPLQDDVVPALAFEIHRLVLLLFERSGEASLLGHGRLVIVLHALDDSRPLGHQRLSRVLDLQIELLHLWMSWEVPRRQPRALRQKIRQPVFRFNDARAGPDNRKPVGGIRGGIDRFELVVRRFFLQALGALARDRFVQRVEPRNRDVLPIPKRQRVLVLAVLASAPPRSR